MELIVIDKQTVKNIQTNIHEMTERHAHTNIKTMKGGTNCHRQTDKQ